jgi:hypothetical protein
MLAGFKREYVLENKKMEFVLKLGGRIGAVARATSTRHSRNDGE